MSAYTFSTCTATVTYISALDDLPNDVGGLTAAQLKAKFDQAGTEIKTFINNVFIPSIQTNYSTTTDMVQTFSTFTSSVQTFSDVITFENSPIIPTPTADYQASTKKYVDDNVGAVVLGQIPDNTLTTAKMATEQKRGVASGVASLGSNGFLVNTEDKRVGRIIGVFDFTDYTINNLTNTTGSITITAGQTTGSITKVYSPTDIRNWDTLKVDVADVSTVNNLYYTVRDSLDSTDLIAQTEITSNGTKVIDLSSISATTYPSILLKYEFARDAVGDTTPKISNNSVAYEGIQSGIWVYLDGDTTSTTASVINIGTDFNFEDYMVKGHFTSGSASGSNLLLQINEDTGSNYDFTCDQIGDNDDAKDATNTHILLNNGSVFSGAYPSDIEVILETPNSSRGNSYYQVKTELNSGQINRAWNYFGKGFYNSASYCSSVQFKMSTGNGFATGCVWKLYGRNL